MHISSVRGKETDKIILGHDDGSVSVLFQSSYFFGNSEFPKISKRIHNHRVIGVDLVEHHSEVMVVSWTTREVKVNRVECGDLIKMHLLPSCCEIKGVRVVQCKIHVILDDGTVFGLDLLESREIESYSIVPEGHPELNRVVYVFFSQFMERDHYWVLWNGGVITMHKYGVKTMDNFEHPTIEKYFQLKYLDFTNRIEYVAMSPDNTLIATLSTNTTKKKVHEIAKPFEWTTDNSLVRQEDVIPIETEEPEEDIPSEIEEPEEHNGILLFDIEHESPLMIMENLAFTHVEHEQPLTVLEMNYCRPRYQILALSPHCITMQDFQFHQINTLYSNDISNEFGMDCEFKCMKWSENDWLYVGCRDGILLVFKPESPEDENEMVCVERLSVIELPERFTRQKRKVFGMAQKHQWCDLIIATQQD